MIRRQVLLSVWLFVPMTYSTLGCGRQASAPALDTASKPSHLGRGEAGKETFVGREAAVQHYRKAEQLEMAGRLDEAIAEYRLAYKSDPKLKEAYNAVGFLLIRTGK